LSRVNRSPDSAAPGAACPSRDLQPTTDTRAATNLLVPATPVVAQGASLSPSVLPPLSVSPSRNKPVAWALQVAILLGAAFPAFLDLYVVHRDGINVVYLDQWLVVPLFQKLYAGTLTLGDLFAQHNEHRILFPRILMLALGAVTRYDTVSEMYCSWLLLVASAFIFYLACRRTLGASRTTTLAILPLSFVAFSLRQQEALLFGFEVQWTLGLTSVLAAIYFLDSAAESKAAFLGAAFAGIVSSYSFASGLLIWPLGLFQLFVAHRGRDQALAPRNSGRLDCN
jgi:hypothetical protein